MIYDEQDHNQVDEIFNRVLFPLLDELLKPSVFLRDPRGMSETRIRASALLCKAFMHFEARDDRPHADVRLLWIQVLDLLDRLMNIDKKDQLVRICVSFRSSAIHSPLDSMRPFPNHSRMSFWS
jgi:golgi-specific brefeldin A-resistance guanine nucleotide exchange factor 1